MRRRWWVTRMWCGLYLTVRLSSKWCQVPTSCVNSCLPTLSSVKSWTWVLVVVKQLVSGCSSKVAAAPVLVVVIAVVVVARAIGSMDNMRILRLQFQNPDTFCWVPSEQSRQQDHEVAVDHAHLFPSCCRDNRLMGSSSHTAGARDSEMHHWHCRGHSEETVLCFKGSFWPCIGKMQSHFRHLSIRLVHFCSDLHIAYSFGFVVVELKYVHNGCHILVVDDNFWLLHYSINWLCCHNWCWWLIDYLLVLYVRKILKSCRQWVTQNWWEGYVYYNCNFIHIVE